MVTVLGGAGTAAPKRGLHPALAACPGHPFAALLAGEATHCIPPSNVPCVNDGRGNDEDDGDHAEEHHRTKHVVHHGAENPGCRRRSGTGVQVRLRHERKMAEPNSHTMAAVNARRRPLRVQ